MKRRSFLKTLAIALVAGPALLVEARPSTDQPCLRCRCRSDKREIWCNCACHAAHLTIRSLQDALRKFSVHAHSCAYEPSVILISPEREEEVRRLFAEKVQSIQRLDTALNSPEGLGIVW